MRHMSAFDHHCFCNRDAAANGQLGLVCSLATRVPTQDRKRSGDLRQSSRRPP